MAGITAEKYDSALLGILQNEGNISNFLQVMLGFLYRRTDFYITMTKDQNKMGFPPGAAINLILQTHKYFEKLATERESRKQKELGKDSKTETSKPSPVSHPETVLPIHEHAEEKISNNNKTSEVPPVSTSETVENKTTLTSIKNTNTQQTTNSTDEEDPEITRQQQVFQENPESYNGAVRENYSWSQSITDVDIRVNVPKSVRKGNAVNVVVDRRHIKVSYKEDEMVLIIDDDLTWDVHKEETIWSLVPGEHIHISLEKKEERWWEGLLANEPKINVRKIDCSRPMTDLDDEAQAKIGEMMYNEEQKRRGLPQSHEQKTHEMMKQAWDAEGSPFKGQPFDPSKFSVNPGGVVSINK